MKTLFLQLFLLAAVPAFGFASLERTSLSNAGTGDDVIYEGVELRTAIKQLCAKIKLNVVFHETFRNNQRYDLELRDVTPEAALKVILIQNQLAARLIENKTIIIYHDNPVMTQRFQEFPVWTPRRQ